MVERKAVPIGWHNSKNMYGLTSSKDFGLTFVVKAVDSVDAGALVVAAQEEEVLRVLDLVCQEQTDGLQRLLAAVHVVAEEEVVGLGRKAAILEKPQ